MATSYLNVISSLVECEKIIIFSSLGSDEVSLHKYSVTTATAASDKVLTSRDERRGWGTRGQ